MINRKKGKIMVICAHPDDIEPQMGGVIKRCTEQGEEVKIVQVSMPAINGNRIIRKKEAEDSANILGANIIFLDNINLDQVSDRELVISIDREINDYQPSCVYTCWPHDSHQDHKRVSNAVLGASRKNMFDLIYFEPIIPCGITPTGFVANMFIDVTDYIEDKKKSIFAHKSQIDKYGMGWVDASIARSRFNGFRIGVQYAESFQIVKKIL
jgi:LmbE family N-acetylglucosaminyl deacetylase